MKPNVTMLKDYLYCPQLSWNRHVALRDLPRHAVALDVGILFHEAMALRLGGKQAHVVDLPSARDVSDDSLAKYNLHKLDLVTHSWTAPTDWKIQGIEHHLESDWIEGRLDALVWWSGKFWSLQWKTYDGDLLQLQEKVRLSFHEVVYQYLATANGFAPWGGTILGACEKLPSFRRINGQHVDVTDEQRIAALSFHYLTRPPAMQEEMLHNTMNLLDKLNTDFNYPLKTMGIPRNYDSCFGKWGRSKCAYFSVCHEGAWLGDPPFIDIENRYTQDQPWIEDAEQGWRLLSWLGEAQWFATKEEKKVTGSAARPVMEPLVVHTNKRVMGGRLRSLDQLIGTIRNAEALGWNLYLNANCSQPGNSKQKLSREDISRWRYIVVDLDPGGDALLPPESEGDLLLAHRLFSGRGYQFWIPLRPVTDPPPDAERIMQGYLRALSERSHIWAPGWIVDTSCSDLARVVRCPGSVNQRTGRRATLEHITTSGGIDIRSLEVYNTSPPPTEYIVQPDTNLTNLLDVLPHLTIRARKFIMEGSGSPGRHVACYAACKSLREVGVDSDRALEWLLIGAGRCFEAHDDPYPFPLHIDEVQRIVKKVYE